MFLKNQALSILRRLGLNLVREPLVTGNVRVLVNHRDGTLDNPGNNELVIHPHADDCVLHTETLAPQCQACVSAPAEPNGLCVECDHREQSEMARMFGGAA